MPPVMTMDDLDVPVALWKGVRSCTQHPIANILSYDRLSPGFRTSTVNMMSMSVPKDIHEALSKPEWKTEVEEEMNALNKNNTWEITDLPQGK